MADALTIALIIAAKDDASKAVLAVTDQVDKLAASVIRASEEMAKYASVIGTKFEETGAKVDAAATVMNEKLASTGAEIRGVGIDANFAADAVDRMGTAEDIAARTSGVMSAEFSKAQLNAIAMADAISTTTDKGRALDAELKILENLMARLSEEERVIIEQTSAYAAAMERAGVANDKVVSSQQRVVLSTEEQIAAYKGAVMAGRDVVVEEEAVAAKTDEAAAATEIGALKMGNAFKKAAFAGTIAFAAIAYESVKSAMGFQSAAATIAGNAGTTVTAANNVAQAFLNTGKAFSGTQMAQAFAPVAGQMKLLEGHALSAAEALRVMSAASDLAMATGGKLGNQTHDLADIMMVFKMHTSQASQAADILFNTSKALGLNTDQLSMAFNRLKPYVAGSGVSLKDAAVLMVDLGRTTGTSMQAIRLAGTTFQNLVSPSKAAQTSLAELGVSLKDAHGKFIGIRPAIGALHDAMAKLPATAVNLAAAQRMYVLQTELATMKTETQTKSLKKQESAISGQITGLKGQANALSQSSIMTALFGKNAGIMSGIIAAGVPGMKEVTAVIGKQGTAAAAAALRQKTLQGEIQTLRARMSDLGTSIGLILIPFLTQLVSIFISVVTPISSFIQHNHAAAVAILAVVGAGIAIVGVVEGLAIAMKIGNAVVNDAKMVWGAYQAILTAFGPTAVEAAAAEDAMAVSTEGATVASEGLTVALLANPLTWLVIGIAAVVAVLYLLITHFNLVKSVAIQAFDFIKAHWALALLIFMPLIGIIVLVVQHWHQISQAADEVWSEIKSIWGAVAGWFSSTVLSPIESAFSAFWNFEKQGFTQIWTDIKAVWNAVAGWFSSDVISPIKGYFTGFWNTERQGFQNLWNAVKAIWGVVAGWFNSAVISPVLGYFSHLWSSVSGLARSAWTAVSGAFKGAAGWFYSNVIQPVLLLFAMLPQEILTALGNLGRLLYGAGQALIQGFIDGINAMIGPLKSAVGFITSIAKTVGHNSPTPLTLLIQNGQDIMKGLTTGLNMGLTQTVVPAIHNATATIAGETTAPAGARSSGGGTTTNVININLSGQVYGSLEVLANDLGRVLATKFVPGSGTRLITT